jgi:AbrB family looped-hinge helix DNA binding protein
MREFKETGIIRRIDDLGRVVISKNLRRVLNISEGDPLEFLLSDDGLFIRKYRVSEPHENDGDEE